MGELQFPLLFLFLSLIPTSLPHGPVQYQKQTDYGTYKYGYDTGNNGAHSFKQEHRGFDGVVHGRYGYTDTDGKLRYVEYTAGPFGFRVKGDNEPSYYTADGLPRSDYKVPTDTDLTDLNAGLAKIAKDQLFGVPVQPYVKGYVGSPPTDAGKVAVVEPVPPPPVVQVPVKGHVEPLPPPVKSVITQPFPQPPLVVVNQAPRVVMRVKSDRPYIKEELPPHRRVVVVKNKPRIPIDVPVVHVQPVAPVQHVVPVQPVVVREQLFDKPVPAYTKGYVPPPPPPPAVHVQPVVPVQQVVPVQHVVVREQLFDKPVPAYTKGYIPPQPPPPPPPPAREIFRQPVPEYTKGYLPAPPPPQPPVKSIVRENIFSRPVAPAYTKSYVPPAQPPQIIVQAPLPQPPQVIIQAPPPQPHRVIVKEELFSRPTPAYTKGYVPPPVVQRPVPVPPKTIIREQIFERPVPVAPKTIVREQIFERPVPVAPKTIVREQIFERPVPVAPKTIVREQIFERPVPVAPKTVVREQIFQRPVPVAPKTIVREHIVQRPVPVVPRPIVREHVYEKPVPIPPKSIVREQIFARPVPEYTKGYVPPRVVPVVREEVIKRPVQHPKGFVPVPKIKGYVTPPPRFVPAPIPQNVYVKSYVPTPRPFVAPARTAYVPISPKTLFEVPAPKYTKGVVPEIRRQTEKGTIVTVQTPITSGRKVPSRGDTGDNLRWVAAPENRYRPEYQSHPPPPAYAYAPY